MDQKIELKVGQWWLTGNGTSLFCIVEIDEKRVGYNYYTVGYDSDWGHASLTYLPFWLTQHQAMLIPEAKASCLISSWGML